MRVVENKMEENFYFQFYIDYCDDIPVSIILEYKVL